MALKSQQNILYVEIDLLTFFILFFLFFGFYFGLIHKLIISTRIFALTLAILLLFVLQSFAFVANELTEIIPYYFVSTFHFNSIQ